MTSDVMLSLFVLLGRDATPQDSLPLHFEGNPLILPVRDALAHLFRSPIV